jgi:AraC-like DNA-binding protein
MVVVRYQGRSQLLLVGPWTTSGVVRYGAGAEILWIKYKLGAFMPHLPLKKFLDLETTLPGAASQSFWLKSEAWQFPNYDNVETFIERLVLDEVLVCDPVIEAALQEHRPGMSPRTVRHHFRRATGLTQSTIRQMKRAQQAATLLGQGVSILDTVDVAGYFDQPHLTRSLKQFIGYTPAQLGRLTQPE